MICAEGPGCEEPGGPPKDAGSRTSEVLLETVLERRSNRLARALMRLGVEADDSVIAYLCAGHGTEREVARLASRKLGARLRDVLVPSDAGKAMEVASQFAVPKPKLILTCEDGNTALERAGVHTLVVGDGPGVRWWRALEGREADHPLGFALALAAPGTGRSCAAPGFPETRLETLCGVGQIGDSLGRYTRLRSAAS